MTAPLPRSTPSSGTRVHSPRPPIPSAVFEAFQEQLFNALQPSLARLMQGTLIADLPDIVASLLRHLSSTSTSKSTNDAPPIPLDRQLADYILFPLFHHLRTQKIRDLPQATQENVLRLLFLVWQRLPSAPTALQNDANGENRAVPLVHDSAAMQSLMIVAPTAAPQSPEDIACQSLALLLVILGHPYVPDPHGNLHSTLSSIDLLTDYSARPDRLFAVPQSKDLTTLSKMFSTRLGNLLFFQLVANLMDVFAASQLLRLRQLALVAVHDLLLVVAQDPDVVGFVLPSVMSKLASIFREPNPNSALVVLGLDVLARSIPFVLQRSEAELSESGPRLHEEVPADAKNALTEWDKFISAVAPPSSKGIPATPFFLTRSFPLPSADFARNAAWFVTTSTNLATVLITIYNTLVPSTASPDVLVSACSLARTLTTYCFTDLATLLPHLFKFAAVCSLSEFAQVRSAASAVIDAMFSLPTQHQAVCIRVLSDALDGLASLASASDEDKVTRLRQLHGCLVACTSSASNSAFQLADLQAALAVSMDNTICAWQAVLVVDSETPLRSETDARFRRWNFVAFHQLPVADAAWDAIGAWARAGGDVVAQGLLGKLVKSSNEDGEEQTNNSEPISVPATFSDDPTVEFRKRLLAARLAAHTNKPDLAKQLANHRSDRRRALYALFAATLAAAPHSSALLQHATMVLEDPPMDPLLPALILTGLEQTALPSYTDFVRTHLPLILVHSTSPALPLQLSAQAYMDHALIPQLKCTSLPELLDKYSPYLMHHVHMGLMYPLLDPGLPKMLCAVARAKAQAGHVTGGWLQELVTPVMEALAKNVQRDELWRKFTLALIEIVRQVTVEPLPVEKREKGWGMKSQGGKSRGKESAWIQKAFGPAAVAATKAAKEQAERIPPWERKRQSGELLPHEKPEGDAEQAHPFDATAHGDDGDDDISTLPGPVQSLLSILHHARNLIHTAPPRTRVELVRLATAVVPKLDTYTKHTRHLVYRILNVMTLDPAKWVGTSAELAYVSEGACEFLAAAARHSPEYAAQKAVEYFGSPLMELVRRGVPAAVDLLVAVVDAEGMEELGAGVVTMKWAKEVVEAAVPRFVAPWAPAMRRHGREDVRPKLEAAVKGLVGSFAVGDGVWASLVAARAAVGPSPKQIEGQAASQVVREWCAGVPRSLVQRWKDMLPSNVDWEQVDKLEALLLSSA